jgi:hypothetical protein
MTTTIYPGQAVRFSNTFTVGGTPTDPDTVTLTVTGPGEATDYVYLTDPEVIRTGDGAFYADIVLTAGTWSGLWVGTGAASGTDLKVVTVESVSRLPYCSLDDVKLARRGMPDALDELVEALIPRASAAIDAHVGRRFNLDATASDRWFPIVSHPEVLIDDLAAAPVQAALVDQDGADSTTLTPLTDLILMPRNRQADEPITSIRFVSTVGWDCELRLRGLWGWPAVPAPVREATIVTVVDWLKDGQGLTPQTANLLEPGAPPFRGLPQKARDLLRPYRRYLVA